MEASRAFGFEMSYDQALSLRSCDKSMARELFLKWSGADIYQPVKDERKRIMSARIKENPLQPKKGAQQVLKLLKEKGYPLIAVTSSPAGRAQRYLESVNLYSCLDRIISVEQVKRGKPYPDVYRYACEMLCVTAKNVIVFEDSPNGIASASKAGCRVIMIEDLSPCSGELQKMTKGHFSDFEKFLMWMKQE
jgi:DNA helicase-2/ATP-dependent DNA helicase PcrA